MRDYYVTLIVSDEEQEETIKFIIGAESFGEAVETIKTELDIE